MAGVHGLQEVERLGATDFADDDPLGTHTQAVLDEITHGDHAFAFDVGGARFEANHVRLLQLKFGRVLAGDDTFVGIDRRGQAVQQRRLAGTGTAGDDDVAADPADDLEDGLHFRGNGAIPQQLIEGQLVLLELSNGERRPVDGERRGDDVDAAAVGKAGVADR